METQGLKRSAPEDLSLLEDVKAVLVDIEGTTTPINFVKETLFPYVRENMKAYLESHWDTDECKADVAGLVEQAKKDKEENIEGLVEISDAEEKETVLDSVVKNVLWQMDLDRKVQALKTLQAHIWREAYKSGKLLGQVFEDVVPAIREWTSEKRKVYVYSSGTVEAQKLLFGYTESGSLTDMLSGNFDLTTGSKVEKDSYTKIASEIDVNPSEVLFLTDIPNEAASASEAGMKTCIVKREGNAPLSEEDCQKFNIIETFADLATSVEVPTKKQEVEEPVAEKALTEESAPQNGELDRDVEEVLDDEEDPDDEAEVIEDDDDDEEEAEGGDDGEDDDVVACTDD